MPHPTSKSAEADGGLWRRAPGQMASARSSAQREGAARKAPLAVADLSRPPVLQGSQSKGASGAKTNVMIARPAPTMAPGSLGREGTGKGLALSEAATADVSRVDLSHSSALDLTITKAKRSDVLKVVNRYRKAANLRRVRAPLKEMKKPDRNLVTITILRAKYAELMRKLQKIGQIAVKSTIAEGMRQAKAGNAAKLTATANAEESATITLRIRIIED